MSTATAQPAENPKKRLLEARRALYRETIIGAAERVFAEHGYDAAKVAAIAKAAGLSLQTLYGIFP
ncbi:MAG: TetR family transcriptional regulator, partial [Myxococcota bacterium]